MLGVQLLAAPGLLVPQEQELRLVDALNHSSDYHFHHHFH
jgi:hypothetical protein